MDKWIKENRITTAIILVLVIVFAAKTSLNTSDVELQTKCASSAKTFFESFVSDPQERQIDEYSNHFNTKLNKCFVLIIRKHQTDTILGYLSDKFLYSAVERKEYGELHEIYDGKIAGADHLLVPCIMLKNGDSNDSKSCDQGDKDNLGSANNVQFDNFVKGYMEI